MRRLGRLSALLLLALPAWGARTLTVQQLGEMLRSMQQEKKSDEEIATALKQVILSQELTRGSMNGLVSYLPGPMSTEQIYVLEARSADLAPPESDLPARAAADAEEQKSILDKAAAYVAGTYDRLPGLVATKTTLRFQDNVEAVASSSGLQSSATDVVVGQGFSNPATFVHYINSTSSEVLSEHGVEKMPAEKDKIPWGANKMIALEEPDPALGSVFREARAGESIRWIRWELVNGKTTAVFSFAVPKKKAHLDVNVCCFPKINQAGIATFYTATTAATLGDGGGGGGGGVTGNFQTNTEWHNYKDAVPYHGEIFVDPETGIVERLIVQGEFKPSEVVHRIDVRIDYGQVKTGAETHIAPVKSYVDTEVVPNGDSGAASYRTRCTLFTSEYKDYRTAGGN
jgi:hypothetical protein